MVDKSTRISVIIPTYNRADLVVEAIRAIQAQSYAVHEIVVVDDGSTDRTRETIASLNGAVRYVYQTNAGKAVALNNGLSHCTGDYIWICDDDDLAVPKAAELLVEALDNSPGSAFAFGRFKRFFIDPKTGERQLSAPVYWPDLEANSLLVALLLDCFIYQNACLVRKRAFDAVGPFRADLVRSQDYEMTSRLVCRFEAVYVPEVVFLQRTHEGSRGSAIDRFDTSKLMEKWLQYDAIFFRELYGKIPLSLYVPKGLDDDPLEKSERAALLQRACIFWRRKLFELSLKDMSEAIRRSRCGPLTPREKMICRDFIHAKFGCGELVTQPELANRLCEFAEGGEFGCAVAKAVTAPLLWFIRRAFTNSKWVESFTLAALLLRIHGYTGVVALVGGRLVRHLRRALLRRTGG
jgi:glycosyltransferase involved in cell wall biosynthesis